MVSETNKGRCALAHTQVLPQGTDLHRTGGTHCEDDVEAITGGAEHDAAELLGAGRRRRQGRAPQRASAQHSVVVQHIIHGTVEAVRYPVVEACGSRGACPVHTLAKDTGHQSGCCLRKVPAPHGNIRGAC